MPKGIYQHKKASGVKIWQIKKGDTPKTNQFSAHAVKLCDMILKETHALPQRTDMNKQDFMSINAVHNAFTLALMSRAIDGEMTKSQFIDAWCAAPHFGRNHRKQKSAKQGFWQAENIEKHFGWIWSEPKAQNEWQEKTAEWMNKIKL